jgi:hypothetical protein
VKVNRRRGRSVADEVVRDAPPMRHA